MPLPDPAATPSPDPNAQQQPPVSAAPSQSAPNGTLEGTGFKWGDEAPESIRGKGARESADYVRQLERTLAQLAAAPPQQPAYQPSQPYQSSYQNAPAPQAPKFDPYADNFSEQVASATQSYAQQAIYQAAPAFFAPLAAIARSNSRANTEYADVYSRYGAEVDALMAPLDPSLKAQPEAWDRAAAMVRGNHYRELVRAEAERLSTSAPPTTERASASGANPPASAPAEDDLAAFWHEDGSYVRALRENGTILNNLYEAARRMGYSPNEYAKTLRGAIVPRPHVRGEQRVA